jgi:endonuclease III
MPGSRPAKKPEKKRAARARPAAGAASTGPSQRAKTIARLIAKAYPDARCMLDHQSPFQLLIATILAAQCTDERVNMTTPALFARFPTPTALAGADMAEIEALIRSTGFFHAKAKSIKGAAEALSTRFPDRFPDTMEELLGLPGVGRKTANVVLGTCFGAPAIIVDTHVRRVAFRLGLTASEDPDRIEEDIGALLPRSRWTAFSNGLTFHGRRCCAARKPDHGACPVAHLCDSREI